MVTTEVYRRLGHWWVAVIKRGPLGQTLDRFSEHAFATRREAYECSEQIRKHIAEQKGIKPDAS